MSHKVVIYFRCKWEDVYRIRQRFGIGCGVTVNGETAEEIDIKDEDWELLRETERRGYIQIRNKNV